ncbi:lactonase family protein [Yeosuana aromativorans]|uniref:lactonase family protein n=1 Tax=Yeosuana aromativorans TaxID=288019 RepID=UPI001668A21D|nr:lactonase family protein [Yeosuana aromativorans]
MNFKLFFLCLFVSLFNCKAQNTPLYIGTYTNGESKGIYRAQFNTKTGELTDFQLAAETENPSYITYSPNKAYIYAVGEGETGTVTSFKVLSNGLLEFINSVPSNGGAPCYVATNKTGNKAVVANYLGGNFSIYNINANGSLNEASQVFDHKTSGQVSHVHSAQFFKNNLFVADLGLNAVYQYSLNMDSNTYKLSSSSIVDIPEKSGPRHFSITKNGTFIYIINELGNSITAVKNKNGQFNLIDNYSTLADDYKDYSACADIHLSKNEQFLYGSNRGENSIVVFKRNKTDGTLKKIQNMSVHGDWPRNFTLDPTGQFLLVANKKSNNISVFKIDTTTGKLTFLHSVKAPSPVCLLF